MINFIEANNIIIKNNKIEYIDLKTKEKKIKNFSLSLTDIHNQLKNMNFTEEYNKTKRIKDPIIENYKMPQFAFVYYYFLAENLRIPSPTELINIYLELFCIKLKDGKYTFKKEYLYADNIIFEYNSLAARIFRAYNSYNREIEFYINLIEKFKEANIEYNLVEDLNNGIDLIINYKDKKYGIATYVGTTSSFNYKNKKNKYRHNYSDIEMIDIIAIMSGKNKNVISIGDTYVYKHKVAYDLKNKIMKNK